MVNKYILSFSEWMQITDVLDIESEEEREEWLQMKMDQKREDLE